MTRKKKRLTLIIAAMAIFGSATGLVLYALRGNIVFFYGPSEVMAKDLPSGTYVRIGGLVKKGSVERGDRIVHFDITDGKHDIAVTYTGALPDLFRQGQGVVAEGLLRGDDLQASQVLAKHDERYMPKNVVEALKKAGRWQENADMGDTAR